MSAHDVTRHALLAYYGDGPNPALLVDTLQANNRTEILTGATPAVEAFPGELDMLRGLVRTLRVVVRYDGSAEQQRAEVRRLLVQHVADDNAAYAEAREANDTAQQPRLTRQMRAMLDALADGERTSETARRLFLSRATIKTHKLRLYKALGARSAGQAVAIAKDLGLLPSLRGGGQR